MMITMFGDPWGEYEVLARAREPRLGGLAQRAVSAQPGAVASRPSWAAATLARPCASERR